MPGYYPRSITKRLTSPRNSGNDGSANAVGNSASLPCGVYVRSFLTIDRSNKRVESATFQTNGCGYVVASADALSEAVRGKLLSDLHSLDQVELRGFVERDLGVFPAGREHCFAVSLEALRSAFRDFRERQIEEFVGEKALICTCFGVTEETIESIVNDGHAASVIDVGRVCNAGTGCGSCQFMIQELIEAAAYFD